MLSNSIDEVQNYLATNYFARTNDAKQASGRALGTIVEIISYYLLKMWIPKKYVYRNSIS